MVRVPLRRNSDIEMSAPPENDLRMFEPARPEVAAISP